MFCIIIHFNYLAVLLISFVSIDDNRDTIAGMSAFYYGNYQFYWHSMENIVIYFVITITGLFRLYSFVVKGCVI